MTKAKQRLDEEAAFEAELKRLLSRGASEKAIDELIEQHSKKEDYE
jgi:hypothetical protein